LLFGTLSVGPLFTFFDLFLQWGILAASYVNPVLDETLHLHIKYFIQVGFIEEFFKLLAFILIYYYLKFNFKIKGESPIALMVYMGMVSLGFASVENIFHAIRSESPFVTLGWRSISAVVAHLFFGLYMGYFIAKAKIVNIRPKSLFGWFVERFPRVKFTFFIVCGLIISSILHGIYNLEIVLNDPNGISGIYILFVALTVGIVTCFRNLSIKNKKIY
jgi:RsiW-degrading membrane proteinase PrsW (M82 family)